jgi:acyl-CoA synthetase (AMP-forming)/AMP-acid ligase II
MIHLAISFALARMGVAHVTIPASDSDQVRRELSSQLKLKVVISDVESIVASTPNALLFNKLELMNLNGEQKDALRASDGSLTWLILQSSGTTGAVKFSELSHQDAINRSEQFSEVIQVQPTDIAWIIPRIDFYFQKFALIQALRGGAAACLPLGMQISHELIGYLNKVGITLASGNPSLARHLVHIGQPMPTLRFYGVTSAPTPEELRRDFKSIVNDNLCVVYGTNETGLIAATSIGQGRGVVGSVGKPTPATSVRVVGLNGELLHNGETGEVEVMTPGSIRSYLDAPDATAASFNNGWFSTGDLGYLTQAGELVLQGRKDDMMIYDGINIYPAEIENALSSHPAVNEVAAFSMHHARFQDEPVAAVTLKNAVSENELVEFAKVQLGIKHPRQVFILKEFPRNPMGKILKRELSAMVTRS